MHSGAGAYRAAALDPSPPGRIGCNGLQVKGPQTIWEEIAPDATRENPSPLGSEGSAGRKCGLEGGNGGS